ncbi:golgi uridine diphosphate-N- acetylglucosamine transporter, partial [Spiromyces aspiralis]
ESPGTSNSITFMQFFAVSAITLPGQLRLSIRPPRLSFKPQTVPFGRWMIMVALFFMTSFLNNLAFNYQIAVPLHIITRSAGPVTSMVLGWLLLGKHYTRQQVAGVLMATVGIVTTALYSPRPSSPTSPQGKRHDGGDMATGMLLLVFGLVLASLLGLYQEVTYRKFGNAWQEGLFYTHFLALPLFWPFRSDIAAQLGAIRNTPLIAGVPSGCLYMTINVLTQLACVSGVHRLSTMASSLTLNLVLNLRKAVSLFLSIVLFGNELTLGMFVGCVFVFSGTTIYSVARRPPTSPTKAHQD